VIGIGQAGPRGEAAPREETAPAELPRDEPAPPIDDRERACWIALAALPGVGPVGFGLLIERYGTARAAWQAGEAALDVLPRVDDEVIGAYRAMRRAGALAVSMRLEAGTTRIGGSVVTSRDRDYPARLAAEQVRPPVLHLLGDHRVVAERCVAIVGTRRASGYGLSVATELADELARAGVVIVSGLAVGIDGAAHRAALAAGGRTAAVLPSPLARVYPPRHRALSREIVERGGLLLSELPAGQVIGKPDFARRNRIIAGLADAVVVVEAPDRSGALLTAQAAFALRRELYAVPGPIDAESSRGCNRLIADHQAEIVTSASALMHRIGVGRAQQPPSVAALSDSEGLVLGQLLKRAASIEELIDRTGCATGVVASALTLLETRGLVSAFGGATFHPTLAARRLAGFA
jgi:DNA processing protein